MRGTKSYWRRCAPPDGAHGGAEEKIRHLRPSGRLRSSRQFLEERKLEAAANKVVADYKASVVAQADQLRAQAKLETFPWGIIVRQR
ncbi:MAG: hypothetical protein U0361_17400 [Nitrospiraceae bacterium]